MNSRILNVIAIGTVAIGALFGVLFLRATEPIAPAYLMNEGVRIPVLVLEREIERERGLSNTVSLPTRTGALFIFAKPGNYSFWMKDMRYPIDIVWIDADWKVLGVTENVVPESYPTAFYPPSDAKYVLEVNAGEARVLKLKQGSVVTFHTS